jgi:hypothetical protein
MTWVCSPSRDTSSSRLQESRVDWCSRIQSVILFTSTLLLFSYPFRVNFSQAYSMQWRKKESVMHSFVVFCCHWFRSEEDDSIFRFPSILGVSSLSFSFTAPHGSVMYCNISIRRPEMHFCSHHKHLRCISSWSFSCWSVISLVSQ